ncbi:MAG: 2-dehydropantoate 2-reductase [Lachnospiraceae bacterium]|nr:2-dehydropantoate 2-reductase [Lachnospiraceae bacterium]
MSRKYCVVGAGGCGGSIAAYMAKAGCDVTLIARGEHLAAIKEHGLTMETPHLGVFTVRDIKAVTAEEYAQAGEKPDVIFVCVKGYSLPEIVPFLQEYADEHTVIIPILNIYGTGSMLQKELPQSLVTDGCIYIAVEKKEPGVILQKGSIFRIVYGVRNREDLRRELFEILADLRESGIDARLSDNIARDAFQKYSYVAPMAACGLYFDAKAEVFQQAGDEREFLSDCMAEINALAEAMGIPFLVDIVKTNLEILDALSPEASTSMQRDIWAGNPSEMDGLVFEPVRMGRKYGVSMPKYEMIARKFGFEE